MREEILANKLIRNAIKYHHLTTDPTPRTLIDKISYRTYNIDKLKQVLNELGWDIIDADNLEEFKDAPPSMRLHKWLVYQK